jgi:hypothetical protein
MSPVQKNLSTGTSQQEVRRTREASAVTSSRGNLKKKKKAVIQFLQFSINKIYDVQNIMIFVLIKEL